MLSINARIRDKLGSRASRHTRLLNNIPAVIYGKNKLSIAIELDVNNIVNIQKKNNLYNSNIIIKIEDKEFQVKVKAMQYHVFKAKLIHIDFIYKN